MEISNLGIKDSIRGWLSEDKTPTSDNNIVEAQLDLLRKYTESTDFEKKAIEESFRSFSDNHDVDDPTITNAYSAVYSRVSTVRKQLYAEVESIRSHYLAETVIDMTAEDALVPDITTGDILEITSKNAKVKKRIKKLEEMWDIDKLILDITPDLIAHGDYTLSTEVVTEATNKEERKLSEARGEKFQDRDMGLVELRDDVCQPNIVPIYEFGEIEGYLLQDDKGKITIKEPADFIHFSLGSKRIRIDTHECFANGYSNGMKINKEVLKDIPRYLRVGRGIIHGVASKFKELELLEHLVPASKLQKLSNGTLLGVSVPAGYDLDKGQKASKKIEGIINKKMGVSKTGDITLENIMNATGSVKVVPLFGDKGRLEILQTRSDEPDDLLNSIEDLRRAILGSIGHLYENIYGGDTSKGELLKRHARYLRLLKNVQRAIAAGIKQMIMIDLSNSGTDFKPDDIIVKFRNKLVEINNLDELEFADTTVQMLDNIKNFIFELSDKENSPLADNINMQDFVKYLDKQLGSIGMSDLIKTEVKAKSDVPGEFDTNPEGDQGDEDPNTFADDPEDDPEPDDNEVEDDEPKDN